MAISSFAGPSSSAKASAFVKSTSAFAKAMADGTADESEDRADWD